VQVDARGRVVVCVSSGALSEDLVAVLAGSGFEVGAVDELDAVGAEIDPEVPAVVVFDGERGDWLRSISDLSEARPLVRSVLLASVDGADEFLAAVTAGVAGFCEVDAGMGAIVRTIESVLDSGVAIPRKLVAPLVEQLRHGRGRRVHTAAGPVDVTEREWEILRLLLQRRSTREMADALFVSVGTVRSHVSTLLRKLGAVDRDDAIALVERGRGG
jgi:DNA-binding NarL/FixJ family response regulator